MNTQSQHIANLINTLCGVISLPVNCFVENEMLCIVSGNDDWRMVIGVFGKADPKSAFFMSDVESSFLTSIGK